MPDHMLKKKKKFRAAWNLEIRHAFHSVERIDSFVYLNGSFLKCFKNMKGMVSSIVFRSSVR